MVEVICSGAADLSHRRRFQQMVCVQVFLTLASAGIMALLFGVEVFFPYVWGCCVFLVNLASLGWQALISQTELTLTRSYQFTAKRFFGVGILFFFGMFLSPALWPIMLGFFVCQAFWIIYFCIGYKGGI